MSVVRDSMNELMNVHTLLLYTVTQKTTLI